MQRMNRVVRKRHNKAPLFRAMFMVAAIGAVTAGITFAALQSQGSALVGNKIESATASLQIKRDDTSYAQSQPGFDFTGVVPNAIPVPTPGDGITLQNNGAAALDVQLSVLKAPTVQAVPADTDVDLSKVYIVLTPTAPAKAAAQTFSLQSLMDTPGGVAIPANHLYANGGAQSFAVQASMGTSAFSGQSLSISDLDLTFTGVVN